MRLILTLGIVAIAGSVFAILFASDAIAKSVGDAIDDFADHIAHGDVIHLPTAASSFHADVDAR